MQFKEYTNDQIIEIVHKCIIQSTNFESKLSGNKLMLPKAWGGEIEGCNALLYRMFLNNLAASFNNLNWLEIGLDIGASLFATTYGNEENFNTIYGIDGWVHHFAPRKDLFYKNLVKYAMDLSKYKIIYHDDFKTDLNNIFNDQYINIPEKIDIYYYDAHHADPYQYNALTYYKKFMANRFLYLVDDADAADTQEGLKKSILDSPDLRVVKSWHLKTGCSSNVITWWCGLAVYLIEKNVS